MNGVVRRLPQILAWLAERAPDAVCLQELKAEGAAFPVEAFRAAGYGAAWVGQARWNGVAILARGGDPVVTRRSLPGDEGDDQARYIEAAVRGVLVGCLYAPNGNPQPGPKFAYKLGWNERLIAHAAALRDEGVPVVLAGDYNIVPTEADIYNSRSWKKNALLQPGPREQFLRLVAQGWADALRDGPAEGPVWTFWDVMRGAWARDAGMRIDHLLVSPQLVMTGAGVDRWVRGQEGASDHAPAWVGVRPG